MKDEDALSMRTHEVGQLSSAQLSSASGHSIQSGSADHSPPTLPHETPYYYYYYYYVLPNKYMYIHRSTKQNIRTAIS